MTSELVLVSRTGALLDNPDFEALIADYYPRILRAALVMTGSSWAAEDLAQETFLQAMCSWRQFERQSRIDTWLYSILLNLHRKQLRSAARSWRRWLVWFERLGLHRKNQSPEGNAEQDEWRESLWRAVSELPVPQKEAIVLRYSQGLGYEQIADVMKCPIGTVKSRLHHGLAALKKKLSIDEQQSKPDTKVQLNSTGAAR